MKTLQQYLTEETGTKYTVFVCDGNAAASRGGEQDHFYTFTVTAGNLKDARRKAVIEVVSKFDDVESYFGEADPSDEDIDYFLDDSDPGSGEPIIYGIISEPTLAKIKKGSKIDLTALKEVENPRSRADFFNNMQYWESRKQHVSTED